MDIEKLQIYYSEDITIQAICDHFADRVNNRKEITVQRLLALLKQDGHDLNRAKLIAGLRRLETVGCGRYVKGSRGWPSRFEWEVSSRYAGSIAARETIEDEIETDVPDSDVLEVCETDAVEHSFRLRPDTSIVIELPVDLTQVEAKRIARFIQSLPFAE